MNTKPQPPHNLLAICLDSGDTLVDEGTEIKDARGAVLEAELIPGAAELVRQIKQRGYPLALVADGPADTFRNVLGHFGLYELFDALAISELVGVEKPDAAMFHTALGQLDIAQADYGRVIMVGNNLSRDILGANALGLITVWIDWAPRRAKIPANALETPDYIIKTPLELLNVINQIEKL
ncbi:MAG: HAD family hydrolase [Caldilineaceae bacterium]